MRRPLPYAFARTHQLLLEDDGHTLTLWHSDAPDLSAWSEVTRRHTVQSFEYTDKATLAKRISEALRIPVIGIGAGVDTDGQILVMHDLLGISSGYIPKFSKNFLQETGDIKRAISKYIDDVKQGAFPGAEHSFN